MKVLKFSVLALFAAIALFACSKSGQQERNIKNEADWTKPEEAVAAVETYLKEYLAKDTAITRYDNVSKQVFYLKPVEVLKTEVYPMTNRVGEVGVKMASGSQNNIMIDFSVAWDTTAYQVNGKDTVYGMFKVGGMSFRQIGDSVRYKWAKQDQFWRKQEPLVQ